MYLMGSTLGESDWLPPFLRRKTPKLTPVNSYLKFKIKV
jgi:hypothetical protein